MRKKGGSFGEGIEVLKEKPFSYDEKEERKGFPSCRLRERQCGLPVLFGRRRREVKRKKKKQFLCRKRTERGRHDIAAKKYCVFQPYGPKGAEGRRVITRKGEKRQGRAYAILWCCGEKDTPVMGWGRKKSLVSPVLFREKGRIAEKLRERTKGGRLLPSREGGEGKGPGTPRKADEKKK